MKKILLLLFVSLIPALIYSQDLTGHWSWISDNGSNSFELDLFLENGILKGYHCGAFYDGLKIDCAEDTDPCSIQLTQVSTGVFEGTIKSGFSLTSGKIQLSYNSTNNSISLKVIEEPEGEYYFPKECVLTRGSTLIEPVPIDKDFIKVVN